MKMKYAISLVICWLCLLNAGFGQQYFKLLEKTNAPYDKKIAHFSNGDILVGGSPIRGQTADQNGGINLFRLDRCGNTAWATNYQWGQNFIQFKDFKVTAADEIYVYGSAYQFMDEYVFILKLNAKGEILAFRVVHMGTVDNFTYNLEVQGDRVMAFGLVLNYNTPKRGFIALFDEKLNYQSYKIFEPFESFGGAIITKDNGFLCRSGPHTYKFDAQSNLEWANTLVTDPGEALFPQAGPIEVSGGAIFEAINDNVAFFYKLNEKGNLLWKSEQFQTTSYPADIKLLSDGNLLAVYNFPAESGNAPCQLRLSSEGKILSQHKLETSQAFFTGNIYASIGDDDVVNVIGNLDIQALNPNLPSGFMLQFPRDSLNANCFKWVSFSDLRPNKFAISLTPQSLTYFKTTVRNVEATALATKFKISFVDYCTITQKSLIKVDTTLNCGQNWEVSLPGPQFTWVDPVIDNPRTFTLPGIYQAHDNNCVSPQVYEYNFQRTPCVCAAYLPTAFSPNGDGQNDQLQLFSNCKIAEFLLRVYDRWGGVIFESTDAQAGWNGHAHGRPADEGVYVVTIQYQIQNDSNEIQNGSLAQNIMLIR
jgi:gliding motility-associated-like protein